VIHHVDHQPTSEVLRRRLRSFVFRLHGKTSPKTFSTSPVPLP
jgi:hypothetical protein